MSGLITLTQAKAYLQITSSDDDALISDYIEMVTGEVEAYCDRTLTTVGYSEVLHKQRSQLDLGSEVPLNMAENRLKIRLRQTPVNSVEAIVQDTTTITSTNYTTNTDNGIITFYESVSDFKDKLVTAYTAGYTTVTGSAFTVPSSLQLVVKEGVRAMYQNNTAAKMGAGNVKSKKLKDFSVSYGNDQTGLYVKDANGALRKSYIAGNATTLNRYRRIGI